MVGQTISHYKILEKLGEGGMGIVYKAHDTKLDRNVALKFLPRDVSLSEEERTRFKHEAKAASALDHPNICTIYEVNETPDGQMFIAMGYYEGTSLNKRIHKGRLDLEEAVGISIQIAEGLEAAHEKGIVHRDIKSGNIIITEKGQVKILDFGLAHKSGLSRLTRTGTTVGTAPYMSPEQAKGEKVDQRSDLWSLGVVLYEMVTGRLPFRGEHEAAILYSVVNEEPKPLEVSVSNSSPELIHIIGRALEKDVAERYQSAAEMLVDLKRLKKETSRTGYQPLSGRKKGFSSRKSKILIPVGLLIVIFIVSYLFFSKKGMGINPNWTQHTLDIPFTEIGQPGISGDGNWIAFTARDHKGTIGIYSMNTTQGGPRLVDIIPNQSWLPVVDVSADGGLLFYSSVANEAASTLDGYVIYSNGPPSRRVFQGGHYSRLVPPDGHRVGYVRAGWPEFLSPSGKMELWSVGIDGSDPRREFIDSVHSQNPAANISFSYSPDGERVAWLTSYPEGYEEIFIYNLETGGKKQITHEKKDIDEVTWIQEDKILYTTNRNGIYNIWMVSAEGGEPEQITKGNEPVMGFKASSNGQKLIYGENRRIADLWIVNLTEGNPHQVTFTQENLYAPALSPDGKEIAFLVATPIDGSPDINVGYGPTHLFVMDRDGKNRRQLTSGDEVVYSPVWSPDSRKIAYGTRKFAEPADSIRTYIIEMAHPEAPKYVAHGFPDEDVGWLDSARIHVNVNNAIYIASTDGTPPTKVYDDSTYGYLIQGGKYLVFQNRHKGKDLGVWITDGMQPREVQRKNARLLPWNSHNMKLSGDGKTLYSIRGVGEIWRMALPDGKEERIKAEFLGVERFHDFYPSWDGKEIIVVKSRQESKIVMIENLFK